MREILFRAKRKDNGEWVEGYFAKGKWYLDEKERFAILPLDLSFYPYCEISEWIEIDPETLCQFTGMMDKNGNRIWESDIVSCEHEKFQNGDPVEQYPFPEIIKYRRNYAVEFINTGSNYWYRLRNKSIHFMLTGNVIYNHKIEVIGNIFDNTELLKGDQSCTDL